MQWIAFFHKLCCKAQKLDNWNIQILENRKMLFHFSVEISKTKKKQLTPEENQ